jgi:riboflavin biosynthesis pyrimidine reductase
VMGGIEIVRHLFLAGLIDELSLITHPVIAGEGRRHLFQPGDPVTRLSLISEQRTSKGNVIATYGLRP